MSRFALVAFTCFILLLTTSCQKESDAPPKEVIETLPAVLSSVNTTVGANCNGFYQALPARYDSTTQKYPLLIFLHGQGELGNGTTDLQKVLRSGPAGLLNKKTFPANFVAKGKNYSFIVLMPQFVKWPSADDVQSMINYAAKTYRIDTTRIYVSGLSMGGGATWTYASKYPSKVAAIVTMTGAAKLTDANAKAIDAASLPVWAFHNEDDKTVDVSFTQANIAKLNNYNPSVAPKVTYWPTGGHDCWTKASSPAYKENSMNIYEWMLQYTR